MCYSSLSHSHFKKVLCRLCVNVIFIKEKEDSLCRTPVGVPGEAGHFCYVIPLNNMQNNMHIDTYIRKKSIPH